MEGRRNFEPMMLGSSLLQLSVRKLLCIQIFMTTRLSARVERMVGVMALVRCSYLAVRFNGSVNHGGGGCDQV